MTSISTASSASRTSASSDDEAQLLIVSHQKRTMETGDALYGVTMAPGGSSQVVSQKVEKEPEPA